MAESGRPVSTFEGFRRLLLVLRDGLPGEGEEW